MSPPPKGDHRRGVLTPVGQWAAFAVVNRCDDQIKNVDHLISIEIDQGVAASVIASHGGYIEDVDQVIAIHVSGK